VFGGKINMSTKHALQVSRNVDRSCVLFLDLSYRVNVARAAESTHGGARGWSGMYMGVCAVGLGRSVSLMIGSSLTVLGATIFNLCSVRIGVEQTFYVKKIMKKENYIRSDFLDLVKQLVTTVTVPRLQ
jgi:hypothetical protein